MASETAGRVVEITARHAAATDVSVAAAQAVRYDHGGGRLYVEGDRRTLVLDCYDEADRELYFSAHADIGFLLAQLSAVTQERDRLRAFVAEVDKLTDAWDRRMSGWVEDATDAMFDPEPTVRDEQRCMNVVAAITQCTNETRQLLWALSSRSPEPTPE